MSEQCQETMVSGGRRKLARKGMNGKIHLFLFVFAKITIFIIYIWTSKSDRKHAGSHHQNKIYQNSGSKPPRQPRGATCLAINFLGDRLFDGRSYQKSGSGLAVLGVLLHFFLRSTGNHWWLTLDEDAESKKSRNHNGRTHQNESVIVFQVTESKSETNSSWEEEIKKGKSDERKRQN